MKRLMLLFAIFCTAASASAGGRDDFSITPGGGAFYAIRHLKGEGKTWIEVVGSPIALQRAINQAKKGGYDLEIKGPFGWHTEAASYIRVNWDPYFGRPKPRSYLPRFRRPRTQERK